MLPALPIAPEACSPAAAAGVFAPTAPLSLIRYKGAAAPTGERSTLEWREAVGDALRDVNLDSDAERWDDCGVPVTLACGGCGNRRSIPFYCERSICPDCARRHSARLRDAWEPALLAVPKPAGWLWRFVTLTVRSTGDMKRDYLTLRAAWKKLRGRWKKRFGKRACGVAAIEVGASWNVHLHTIALLPWIELEQLRAEWAELTQGSYMVNVQLVRGGLREGLREVTKYVTKVDVGRSPAMLAEIYRVFKGAQTHRPWGSLHGKIRKPEHPTVPCDACGGVAWFPYDLMGALERSARAPP